MLLFKLVGRGELVENKVSAEAVHLVIMIRARIGGLWVANRRRSGVNALRRVGALHHSDTIHDPPHNRPITAGLYPLVWQSSPPPTS